MSVQWVNKNTIRGAEDRVEVYIKAAWAIHDGKIARIRSVLEILTQEQEIRDLLGDTKNRLLFSKVRENLEAVRKEQNMDILTLLDSKGGVVLRTRPPYNDGDFLSNDPMVKKVIQTKQSSEKNIILSSERLEIEGEELVERCMTFGREPRGMLIGSAVPIIVDDNLIGIIQMGNLLNGATEEVDRIREGVFENKQYKKKPVGTATIFMGDLRISTNVLDDQGRRAIGTRVSKEVAGHVLTKGLSWTGRAWVVNAWYLSQYDPIKDPDGSIIGMLYVGELEQKYLDMRTRAVISHLSVIFAGMIMAFLVLMETWSEGFNVVQKLRKNEKTSGIPRILLTAMGLQSPLDDLTSPGMNDVEFVLQKPVKPATFLEYVRKSLGE
jgi:two-component system NtrC family sensor kinase